MKKKFKALKAQVEELMESRRYISAGEEEFTARKEEEADWLKILIFGTNEIMDKLKERGTFWKEMIKTIEPCILLKYDRTLSKNIKEMIKVKKELFERVKKQFQEREEKLVEQLLKGCGSINVKISKRHEKEVRTLEMTCYKPKNNTIRRMGKIQKKKKLISNRRSRKVVFKKKMETRNAKAKEMLKTIKKTDFNNRCKLWMIKYNMLKEDLRRNKETVEYSFERAENVLRKKFKRERKYKLLKMVKQKRKDPVRKRQANHLIRSNMRNKLNLKKYGKVWADCSRLVEYYMVDFYRQDECDGLRLGYFFNRDKEIEYGGYPVWYTEEEIKNINLTFGRCFEISTRTDLSIFDEKLEAPDIDLEDRSSIKNDLLEEARYLLHDIWPEKFIREAYVTFTRFPCTLR